MRNTIKYYSYTFRKPSSNQTNQRYTKYFITHFIILIIGSTILQPIDMKNKTLTLKFTYTLLGGSES